jgi:protein-disulfide isomerase
VLQSHPVWRWCIAPGVSAGKFTFMSMSKEVIQTRDIYIGNPSAPVIITSYIDYESQACAELNKVLNELLEREQDKVRLTFRHFPMANKHQKAMKAAEAAIAAAQDDLFWPMHNILFSNRTKLGTISLKQYAREAGVQNKRFLDQLVNGTYAWQVREDLLAAVDKGIRSAPAVYMNDVKVEEELSYENLSRIINDDMLQR